MVTSDEGSVFNAYVHLSRVATRKHPQVKLQGAELASIGGMVLFPDFAFVGMKRIAAWHID
jgi:hypothetical protein